MRNFEIMKNGILYTLCNNKRWMTASEIIKWASSKNITEKKHKSRQANSHPMYRALSAMCNVDEHNIYTPNLQRRIRTSGPETGSYEYTTSNVISRFIETFKTI